MADAIQLLNTRQALKRVRGGRDGIYPFLENDTWDIIEHHYDFGGDALPAELAAVLTDADGDLVITAAPNLATTVKLRASASSDDDESGMWTVFGNLGFDPALNPVFSVRFSSLFVDTTKIEIGWGDSITNEQVANDLAANTATADNGAVFVLDLHDSGNATKWQLFAVNATTPLTKIEPDVTPVAATYQTMVVGLSDTTATFAILDANGGLIYGPTPMAAAIDGTTALTPHIRVTNRDATDVNELLIDFVNIRHRRTAA